MSEIIKLDHIYKSYKPKGIIKSKQEIRILKDISISVEEGETLGIVGESSSGKTTTTRIVLGQEEPTSGDLYIKGIKTSDMTKSQRQELQKKMQVVFQNPYSSLDPTQKIRDILAEPLEISQNCEKKEIDSIIKKMLEKVGLAEDYLDRYSNEFSGGQLQRIAIVRALINEPDLIVLDEPVSALDVSVRGQIMNLLKSIKRSSKVSYIFISHDIRTIGFLSDKVAVMYFGYIVEYGKTAQILEKYRHPYTEMLISSDRVNKLDDIEETSDEVPSYLNEPKGCPFYARCKYATKECQESIPVAKEIEPGHFVACHRVEELATAGRPVIGYSKSEYNI